MATPAQDTTTRQRSYSVPLLIAITGHRDLVQDDIPIIRSTVRDFLSRMLAEHPDRGVTLLSSLAAGADQLVADEAHALGIPLIVPLPMPKDLYIRDFTTTEDRDRFERLLGAAEDIIELPMSGDNTRSDISEESDQRDQQYVQLGVFLCAHCHILLALWDGKYSTDPGGTGAVVRYHHDDVVPGAGASGDPSLLILAEDESDLVYHVVCPRDRPDGQPADGLQPLSASWFTTDEDEPRPDALPPRYRLVFERTSEFSRDAQRHRERIATQAWSLVPGGDKHRLPEGALDINHYFEISDWLAIHFQKRHLFMLRVMHVLAMLMGLTYIAYSDVSSARPFVIAFIALFIVAAGIYRFGRRMSWHRKYLDYRTLAEGLRVQFYWAVAGVSTEGRTKFAHENFLQMQDADLGWIRNVMRVAGLEADVDIRRDPTGIEFATKNWVGNDTDGQLGYYRRKTAEKISSSRRIERLATVVLGFSAVAIAIFAFSGPDLADSTRDEIILLMGVLLLTAGVVQSYSHSVAHLELTKQYEFMCRTFAKARRRLLLSRNDAQRRKILRLVGDASLEEHAEWLLMHRERSVSEGELWRMVGG